MNVSYTASVGPFDGYVVFLRRVTVTYWKPITFIFAPWIPDTGHRIRLSRNGLFVPNVESVSMAPSQRFNLNTAIWVEPTDVITAHVNIMYPAAIPTGLVHVAFAGTLIPYSGEPAVQMAGSNERSIVERFKDAMTAVFRGVAR